MKDLAEALWRQYRETGDSRARNQLLDRYLGLVHHSAHQLARRISRDIEIDELVGAGTIGLVQALEGFDPSRGLAFSTYAMPRIRGAMLDELRGRDWMPRSIRMRSRQLAEARSTLQQKLGRAPDPGEMAEQLGLELDHYWRWVDEVEGRVVIAMDAGGGGDEGEARLSECIPDVLAVMPGQELDEAETLAQLRSAFDALPEKDRIVLSLYYYEELNLRQIGEVLHVSESRVSQIRTRALKRLRELVALVEEGS